MSYATVCTTVVNQPSEVVLADSSISGFCVSVGDLGILWINI